MGERSVPVVHNNPAAHRRLLAQAINKIFGELSNLNFGLSVARGLIPGMASVNKFGRCPDNVDNGTASDIWDGANAATGTKTWVAPTAARIHDIASTSASDAAAGVGARTVQVMVCPTGTLKRFPRPSR